MRRVSALLFVLALGVRLTLLFGFHRYEINTSETQWIARTLARTGEFADPYVIPTGPTAHSAPLYPAVSSIFYTVFGDARRADVARFAFNAVGGAGEYALLPVVAEALGLGWPAGAIAGLAGALVPLHYWADCVNDFENAWTGLFLEIAALWFLRLLRRPVTMAAGARAGAFWGIGLLLAPTVAPVLAGLLAIAAWKRRLNVRWAAALAGMMLVALAPWSIRNWARLGGPALVRDDLGLELFISNQDAATPVFDVNSKLPYWAAAHPHASVAAAEEIRQVGELEFERRKLREALEWIRSHPQRFASLSVSRAFHFWFPAVPRWEWAIRSVTVLAALGWALLFAQRRFAAIVLATLMLAYSAPFTIIQVTLRYQHPIWWALLLSAAWPLAALGYTKRLRSTPNAT